MKKKYCLVLLVSAVSFSTLFPFDLGIIGGFNTSPSHFVIGFSGSSGLLLPMVSFEFEIYNVVKSDYKTMTGGIKFRPKLGKISPYGAAGFGTEYLKFNFRFSEYRGFSYIGGGIHFFVTDLFSLRCDIRFTHFSERDDVRLSGGLFLHP